MRQGSASLSRQGSAQGGTVPGAGPADRQGWPSWGGTWCKGSSALTLMDGEQVLLHRQFQVFPPCLCAVCKSLNVLFLGTLCSVLVWVLTPGPWADTCVTPSLRICCSLRKHHLICMQIAFPEHSLCIPPVNHSTTPVPSLQRSQSWQFNLASLPWLCSLADAGSSS